ncbi:MAG: hemolysin family protein [Thermoanaerobaculia bacterium]|nr:hemolysin family protein [Thermoanaerobaculia bacterium]
MSDAPTPYLLPLALVAGTLLLQLLSAGLERTGPIRLRHWTEEAGGRLRALYERPARFEAVRALLHLAAYVGVVALLAALAAEPPAGAGLPLPAALVLAAAVPMVGDYAARALVLHDAESTLRKLTWVYRLVYGALSPLAWVVGGLFAATLPGRREEEDDASAQEIEAFLDVGAREGILDSEEQELIHRLIDFGDTRVKSVMTPRTDMVLAPADSSLEELARLFLESRHSRIPIYRESVDEIVGILHIRDLLAALRGEGPSRLQEIALRPYVVPESKSLEQLLRDFQARALQMAIVVDEYGGTAGLVTVEDLLEEIVGEIVDEHEEVEELTEALPGGGWRIDGRTPVPVLADLFGVTLEEAPYETVGGLIFGLLGSVPKPGHRLEALGLAFTVEGVEDRRIQAVKVARVTPEERAGDA